MTQPFEHDHNAISGEPTLDPTQYRYRPPDHKAVERFLKFGFHSSLLKWVAEDQATDADDGEHNGPGTGCEQNNFCGICDHLNPPSRQA